jgi:hypothetical protein
MTVRRWCLAGLLAALVSPLAAGDGPGPGGPPPGARGGNVHQEVFKMIDAYLLANVQDALGLSDEQNTKVLPLVLKLQGDRRSFHRRRGKVLGEMKKALGSGTATEAAITDGMKEFRAIEAEELETIRKDTETIDKELTVVQQAKLRILEREVERKIQGLVMDHRMKMRPDRDRPRGEREGRPQKPPKDGAEDSAPKP